MTQLQTFRCACAFAKSVGDTDPTNFPRAGVAENVLLKGHFILRHTPTNATGVIARPGAGAWHAEADECCFDYFDGGTAARAALEQEDAR